MIQRQPFIDNRLNNLCIYCSAVGEDRDHIPSKVLLDKPYPENLPVVISCKKCNNSFSFDELYFACVIECLVNNTIVIDKLTRKNIKKHLKNNSKLYSKIKLNFNEEQGIFNIEVNRFNNVILKNALGHMVFENGIFLSEKPKHINFQPLHTLTEEQKIIFESFNEMEIAPEVGSRGLQSYGEYEYWINVQKNNYSYYTSIQNGMYIVRMIIRNYLACEVIWFD